MPQALPRPTHLPPAEPCSNPDLTDIEESACSSPPADPPMTPTECPKSQLYTGHMPQIVDFVRQHAVSRFAALGGRVQFKSFGSS